jgi:VWFA-related protein
VEGRARLHACAAQTIETFERVDVRGFTPHEERREPQTVTEARAMAEDPRSRLFVLFLDTYHTQMAGSRAMRPALLDLLNRVVGPDDMFAIMTPEMSAADLAFARRTTTVEGELTKHWYWGRRDRLADRDPEEERYVACFPSSEFGMIAGFDRQCRDPRDPTGRSLTTQPADFYTGVAREMIARRRERLVLDAFRDLTLYLGGIRDERKAVIAITDGWALYRPNPHLARLGVCDPVPGAQRVGTGPDGRLTTDVDRARGGRLTDTRQACEEDRQVLAHLDNWQTFHDLFDYANRFNVSFYPIDSRGLPVFDAQIWEGVPPVLDAALLRNRIQSLRTLAENTDGLAVVDSNDLTPGIRRIVDDLTSYYLIGYYSTNPRFDGTMRSIRVRVKRPGVEVRARRGYRAVSEEDLARAGEMTATAVASALPSALQNAIASLAVVRHDTRFLTHVSWIAAPIHDELAGAKSHVWITGELDSATVRADGWAAGAKAEILLTAEDGGRVVDETRTVTPPVRHFTLDLPDVALGPGDYALRVRLRPAGDGLPFMDTIRFTVPEKPPATGQPRLLRRGQTTGNRFVATADPRFRRTEWLRVEVPMHGAPEAVSAELLDRAGNPIPVPVTTQPAREDGEGGLTWAAADVSLAPLAPGDYAVRSTITRGTRRAELITAFRIVP